MKQRTKRTPSVLVSGLSLVLVIAVVVIGIRIGIGSQMSLFCGAVVAMVVGLLLGIPWEEIQKSMLKVIDNSMVAMEPKLVPVKTDMIEQRTNVSGRISLGVQSLSP